MSPRIRLGVLLGCLLVLLGLPGSGPTARLRSPERPAGPSQPPGGVAGTAGTAGITRGDRYTWMSQERLWALRIEPYLRQPLWHDGRAYDAGHVLQVPLHAAFTQRRGQWVRQFAEHFRRFMAQDPGTPPGEAPLNRLQYLYLASRFAVLCHRSGQAGLVAPGLEERLRIALDHVWFRQPAWMWGRRPFPGGLAERVRWKLDTAESPLSYYRAIIDQEFYAMVLAADLRQLDRVRGRSSAGSPAIVDALALAGRVFSERVRPTPVGGWLIQPGVWTDHPDVAYAGAVAPGPDPAPARVPDLAEDTSHSHRYPLWLTSLAEAYPRWSAERLRYAWLRGSLATQLLRVVLVRPGPGFPSYRTKNFMDGRNGRYRWVTNPVGPHSGYGPYELSGTFLLGWWGFLGQPEICTGYRDQASRFPLDPGVIAVYRRPGTPAGLTGGLADGSVFRNGLILLLVRLAAGHCPAIPG